MKETYTVEDLKSMAKQLRLTLMGEQMDVMLESADKAKMTARELIGFMFSQELQRRKQHRTKMGIMSAHFPMDRTLAEFDFSVIPAIDPGRIRDLASLDWVRNGSNLLLQGPPGVGKTHLAIGLGRVAIEEGFKVLFTTANDLVEDLSEATRVGKLKERISELAKPAVLVIDELGYFPLRSEAGHLLFALFNARYERKSIVVTCNRSIGEWGMLLGDPTAATAILDRFLHHSEVMTINGDSYRLLEKRRSGLLTQPSD
jgi:DNA replication protein DnaC